MKARTDLPALDAIRAIEPEMLATRHRIHANPELAFVGDGPKRLGLRADRDALPIELAHIAARQPFSGFGFSRLNADGTRQHFRASGEPIFNQAKGCTGCCGIGAQIAQAGPADQAAAHTAQ